LFAHEPKFDREEVINRLAVQNFRAP